MSHFLGVGIGTTTITAVAVEAGSGLTGKPATLPNATAGRPGRFSGFEEAGKVIRYV